MAACFARSVGVEFDLYQNSYDPDNNHVGIFVDGDLANDIAVATPMFDLAAAPFTAWVDYDLTTMKVYVAPGADKPAQPLLAVPLDLAGTLDPTLAATAGFTGATGIATAVQDILSWRFEGSPADVRVRANAKFS